LIKSENITVYLGAMCTQSKADVTHMGNFEVDKTHVAEKIYD